MLAWKIPQTEEPGRLQSMGSQRVRHDWATNRCGRVLMPFSESENWGSEQLNGESQLTNERKEQARNLDFSRAWPCTATPWSPPRAPRAHAIGMGARPPPQVIHCRPLGGSSHPIPPISTPCPPGLPCLHPWPLVSGSVFWDTFLLLKALPRLPADYRLKCLNMGPRLFLSLEETFSLWLLSYPLSESLPYLCALPLCHLFSYILMSTYIEHLLCPEQCCSHRARSSPKCRDAHMVVKGDGNTCSGLGTIAPYGNWHRVRAGQRRRASEVTWKQRPRSGELGKENKGNIHGKT